MNPRNPHDRNIRHNLTPSATVGESSPAISDVAPSTGSAPSVDLLVRRAGNVTVVEFLDRRLIDTARIQTLGNQIMELVVSGAIKLVINFAKVEYLSSSMLNVLIELDNLTRKHKGHLALANLAPELQKVFTLMKLHKALRICPSVDDAVLTLKQAA